MRRREIIALIGAAAASPIAWTLAAKAQQRDRVRRVGVLMGYTATQPEGQSYLAAFVEGLRQSGWTEGQNLRVDVRWNAGDAGLARTYAGQLIGLMPDVILTSTTINLTEITHVTSTVPVVFVTVTDPVVQGFVASMRHPGGNLTGFSNNEFSLGGKWLDLLKKVSPRLARVAVLFNPDESPQSRFFVQAIESAAVVLGVQVIAMPVRVAVDIEPAMAGFASQPNGGLIVPTGVFTRTRFSMIGELAARYRLPSIAAQSGFATEGGLMDYSTTINLVGQFRQAAGYVHRILKGEKPGDLPIQGSDRYTFVINLKTAKALGLEIPPDVLSLADGVIE